jgi:prephenate dehydrogenase
MNATIIGLGLIGGSLSKDLKARGILNHVVGVDANATNASEALKLKLADEIKPLEESFNTDLIILAIPVDAIKKMLPEILNRINPKTIVIDTGSTKEGICYEVRSHKNRNRFVAAHPIAGTENTGPSAAINNLFDHKVSIICEKELSDKDAIETAAKLFSILKMKLIYMNASDHDMHLAYISHLSHISSFALGNTVLDIEKNHKNIFNLAGSGFASTVRLAKSSPDMWQPILEQNSENVLKALDAYIQKLEQLRKLITEKNSEEIHRFMAEANEIRKILENI